MAYGNNSMKIWREKVLRKYPNQVYSVCGKTLHLPWGLNVTGTQRADPYTCLGDSMWQGPKELIWLDCCGWTTGTTVSIKKKWWVLYPPLTFLTRAFITGCFERKERKERKMEKMKREKNRKESSSFLFRGFMLRLIPSLF